MAERRMFTKKITESDAFLDMPTSAQALYFHLSMNADDDGFINNPNSIRRTVGASEDDLKILLAKKFIIHFESGVIVIKHWKMHNYIQKDRYKPTDYVEERACLSLDDKNAYSVALEALKIGDSSKMDTECIQDGYIGKDRLGKDRLGKDRLGNNKATYFPNDEKLNQTFLDYIDMRKKIKAPMTEKAITLALIKLDKLSNGDNDLAIAILEQSIMNSWKGLFEIKQQSKHEQTLAERIMNA